MSDPRADGGARSEADARSVPPPAPVPMLDPGARSIPTPQPEPDVRSDPAPPPGHRPSGSVSQATPSYKGQPLDEARGPGLGCFWSQVILLGFLLVFTPLTVVWAWDSRISAILLIITLLLLLFAGNTVIFLMRLVAADRRGRRRPLSGSARRTVGQMEDATPADEAPTDRSEP